MTKKFTEEIEMETEQYENEENNDDFESYDEDMDYKEREFEEE